MPPSPPSGRTQALGITDDERASVAQLYAPGASVWRVLLPHLSSYDMNMGAGVCTNCSPPPGGTGDDGGSEKGPPPGPDDPACDTSSTPNSVVDCYDLTLSEHVPVSGTPYTLHYNSDRMPGRAASRIITLPMVSDDFDPSLVRGVRLAVAPALGAEERYRWTVNDVPATFTWTWSGLDAFDRPMRGAMPVTFRLGYEYDCVYTAAARFGSYGGAVIDPLESGTYSPREDCRVALERTIERTVEVRDQRDIGLGGWALDVHHAFDPATDEILYGDGSRGVGRTVPVIEMVADTSYDFDDRFDHFTVAADGTIYTVNAAGIQRNLPDGTRQLWLAKTACTSANATQDVLCRPHKIAAASDGHLYVWDDGSSVARIVKIDRSGQVVRVAGSIRGHAGDGGPALDAQIENACDLEVSPDGSVYILDCVNAVVRRIGPEGIIERVAGTGAQRVDADPFIEETDDAKTVALSFDSSWWARGGALTLDPNGGFYIIESGRPSCSIRHVAASGRLTTVRRLQGCRSAPLGNGGTEGYFRDGALDATGGLLVEDQWWRIYRLDLETSPPTLEHIAGTYESSSATGPACAYVQPPSFPTRRKLSNDVGVVLGPDGRLYMRELCETHNAHQSYHHRILRLRTNGRGGYGTTLVASSDVSEVYEFDAAGRHLYTYNALTGAIIREFEYDSAGRLAAIEDGDGNRTEVQRDGQGTRIVGPFGQVTELDFDSQGYLSYVRPDPEHPPYAFEYDANGLMVEQVDPRGATHVYGYDSLGRVNLDQDPAGGYFEFDVTFEPGQYTVTKTSAEGRVTVYDWQRNTDGNGQFTITFPTGQSNTRVVRTNGTSTTTMADGTVVNRTLTDDPTYGMDAPLVTETTTLPGLTHSRSMARTTTFTQQGNPLTLASLTETQTENNRVTTRTFSAATRTWATTSPEGRTSSVRLDEQGRVVETSTPGTLPVELSYDTNGRLIRTEQGTTRFTDFAYDPTSGFLSSQTNALTETTTYATDAVGRVTTTTRADGSAIGFEYDGESNLTGLTPPERPEHELTYTPVDLAEDYEAPTVGATPTVTHNQYNLDRQLTSVTQPDGQVQSYGYDPTTGLLETATIPGAGTYTYGYDTRDRLTSVTTTGGFGSVTFAYNGSLTTSTTIAGPQTVSDNGTTVWSGTIAGSVVQGYDNAFNVRSVDVRTSGGTSVFGALYGRDDDDLVTSIAPLAGGSSVPTMTLTRSPLDGHLTDTTLGVVTTAYDLDVDTTTPGTGDLLGISASVNGTEVFGTSYQRDALGRITRVDELVQGVSRTRKYEYDAAGRLTAVRDENDVLLSEYEYDGNGARTRAVVGSQVVELGVNLGCGAGLTDPVDAQDRLCRYGDYEYAYDANGRLASKTHVTTGAVTEYGYDGLGRLRWVELPGGSRIDYVLDALGRRIGKVVDGVLVKGWLYGKDTLKPLAQVDASGQIEATFVYETGVNVPDYIVHSSGAVLRVLTDHLGSVRLMADVASGSVVQRIDYDEFGNVLADSNPGFQPFGFAGGLYDADTGLVRFGARDYDPVVGRWTAKDPLIFDGGDTNLYAYVGNDPVNRIDPSGKMELDRGTKLDCIRSCTGEPTFLESVGDFFCEATCFGDEVCEMKCELEQLERQNARVRQCLDRCDREFPDPPPPPCYEDPCIACNQ